MSYDHPQSFLEDKPSDTATCQSGYWSWSLILQLAPSIILIPTCLVLMYQTNKSTTQYNAQIKLNKKYNPVAELLLKIASETKKINFSTTVAQAKLNNGIVALQLQRKKPPKAKEDYLDKALVKTLEVVKTEKPSLLEYRKYIDTTDGAMCYNFKFNAKNHDEIMLRLSQELAVIEERKKQHAKRTTIAVTTVEVEPPPAPPTFKTRSVKRAAATKPIMPSPIRTSTSPVKMPEGYEVVLGRARNYVLNNYDTKTESTKIKIRKNKLNNNLIMLSKALNQYDSSTDKREKLNIYRNIACFWTGISAPVKMPRKARKASTSRTTPAAPEGVGAPPLAIESNKHAGYTFLLPPQAPATPAPTATPMAVAAPKTQTPPFLLPAAAMATANPALTPSTSVVTEPKPTHNTSIPFNITPGPPVDTLKSWSPFY